MKRLPTNHTQFIILSLLLLTNCGIEPTQPEEKIPDAPSDLTVTTLGENSVSMTWVDNSDNELGFILERSETLPTNFATIETVGINVIAYTDAGLEPNTVYFYRVEAFNALGTSSYSNIDSASTANALPNAPSNLTVTATDYHANYLSWVDNSDDEEGFSLERSVSDTLNFLELMTMDPNITTFADTGLQSGVTYNYRVQAFNSTGVSAYSNVVSATTLIPTIALSPDNISISVGEEVDLTLQIRDFLVSIFGVSLRISYNSNVVSFTDSTGFAVGDFFGAEIVTFVKDESSNIHLTITLTQGQEEVNGSGDLGRLTFIGQSPGNNAIEIIPPELYFYDSVGSAIIIPDIEIESAMITVQ